MQCKGRQGATLQLQACPKYCPISCGFPQVTSSSQDRNDCSFGSSTKPKHAATLSVAFQLLGRFGWTGDTRDACGPGWRAARDQYYRYHAGTHPLFCPIENCLPKLSSTRDELWETIYSRKTVAEYFRYHGCLVGVCNLAADDIIDPALLVTLYPL